MKTLFIHLSILSLACSCSYLYAVDHQSKMAIINTTQQELDAIHRDQLSKAAQADAAITTLRSVLTKETVSLVIDFLRTSKKPVFRTLISALREEQSSGIFAYSIMGITPCLEARHTIDITTTLIQKDDLGPYSMRQGNLMYNHATDTFTPLSLLTQPCSNTVTCLCCNKLPQGKAWEKLDNLDKQKSLSTVTLADGTTITALSPSQTTRFLCLDSNNALLTEAHTRWVSNDAYTKWLSRINNKSLVKSLKWNGQ